MPAIANKPFRGARASRPRGPGPARYAGLSAHTNVKLAVGTGPSP